MNDTDKLTGTLKYARQIFENGTSPLLIFDASNKLVYANSTWFKYCDCFTPEEIIGKHAGEIFEPISVIKNTVPEIMRLYYAAAIEKKSFDAEQDFTFGYFIIQFIPLFGDGGVPEGIAALFVDITETERARRVAEQAREHAEQFSDAKTEFLAKMSHEIRTPMSAIIGMAELALHEDGTLNSQEHILTIKQAGLNLLSIINDILDFSKIEKGILEIIPDEYLFATLINDVINIIKTRILESRLRFIVNVDSNIPNKLIGDAARIRQIMLNLLSNAIKFTEKGYVTLSVEGEPTESGEININIEVKDSGTGIRQEELPKLFEDFVQFDYTSGRHVEGAGLGLAITHNLVKAMHGSIDVTSEYGAGSTFTVSIPQKYREEARLAYIAYPERVNVLIYERREQFVESIIKTMKNLGVNYRVVSSATEFYERANSKKYTFMFVSAVLFDRIKEMYPNFETDAEVMLISEFGEAIHDRTVSIITTPIYCLPVANFMNGVSDSFTSSFRKNTAGVLTAPDARVLVVDDINTNLKVTEGLLQYYKIHVDLCKNGLEAVEAVKSVNYDLILMDHLMPEMNGLEALRAIRSIDPEDPYYKKLPIIALTANVILGTKEMFLASGFDDFLSKPIDTYKLHSVLEKWLPKEKQKTNQTGNLRDGWGLIKKPDDNELSISGINVKKGISITGGNIDNYFRILETFYRDGIKKLQEIKEDPQKKDLSVYTTYIHALKSASSVIGAESLSEKAKLLENAGNSENYEYINKNTGTLLAELRVLLTDIKNVLENASAGSYGFGLNKDLLFETLVDFKKALKNNDADAVNKGAAALQKYARAEAFGELIMNILKNKMIGEFETAALLTDDLLWAIENADK